MNEEQAQLPRLSVSTPVDHGSIADDFFRSSGLRAASAVTCNIFLRNLKCSSRQNSIEFWEDCFHLFRTGLILLWNLAALQNFDMLIHLPICSSNLYYRSQCSPAAGSCATVLPNLLFSGPCRKRTSLQVLLYDKFRSGPSFSKWNSRGFAGLTISSSSITSVHHPLCATLAPKGSWIPQEAVLTLFASYR